jgi:hypothetical protein
LICDARFALIAVSVAVWLTPEAHTQLLTSACVKLAKGMKLGSPAGGSVNEQVPYIELLYSFPLAVSVPVARHPQVTTTEVKPLISVVDVDNQSVFQTIVDDMISLSVD